MGERGSVGFRWTLRLILWAVGIAVMIPLYRAGTAYRSIDVAQQCLGEVRAAKVQLSGLYQQQRFCLCMFLRSSYLESRRMEPALKQVMALGEAPCEHVGIWKSARQASVYRVAMRDDNTFSSEAVSDFTRRRGYGGSTGYWGETDGSMVWIYDSGAVWPPDIDHIESDSPDKFILIEADGERTEFTRERALDSARCPSA